MAGKGIAAIFTETEGKMEIRLDKSTTDVGMKVFKKYLKHKETRTG